MFKEKQENAAILQTLRDDGRCESDPASKTVRGLHAVVSSNFDSWERNRMLHIEAGNCPHKAPTYVANLTDDLLS